MDQLMNTLLSFTKLEKDSIKLEHFSTSSQIKLTLTSNEEIKQGTTVKSTEVLWFEYHDFQNLIDLLREF
jgi:hypothetical protein